jgi:hypothetical protein
MMAGGVAQFSVPFDEPLEPSPSKFAPAMSVVEASL